MEKINPLQLPVIIGVTGHRDIVQSEDLCKSLRSFFVNMKTALPHTDIIIMSGLAQGADILVSQIAMEVMPDQVRLYAVLPFEQSEYEKDFDSHDSLDAFRKYLNLSWRKKIFENKDHDESAYSMVGDYIIEHANILLALWDGKLVFHDESKKEIMRGGTCDVCKKWLTRAQIDPGLLFDASDTSLLIRFPVIRKNSSQYTELYHSDSKIFDAWSFTSKKSFTSIFSIRDTGCALKSIELFNAASLSGNKDEISTSKEYLGLIHPHGYLDELADRFAFFDSFASSKQRIFDNNLSVMVILSLIVALLSLIYGGLNHEYFKFYICNISISLIELALPFYLISYVVMILVYCRNKKQSLDCLYLDFRAAAEFLRVKIYWKVAGIHKNLSQVVMRKNPERCEWLSIAFKNWDFLDHDDNIPNATDLKTVWVADQMKYYTKTAHKQRKYSNIAKSIANFFYMLSFVVAFVFLMITINDKIIGASSETMMLGDDFWLGIGPLLFAILGYIVEKKGWNENVAAYQNSYSVFEVVYKSLQSSSKEDEHSYFEYLGEYALQEHGEWLQQHRNKQPEPNL